MPDNQHANAAVDGFVADLDQAREAVGAPSFERMEDRSRDFTGDELNPHLRIRLVAASTTHDILSGKRRRLPPWAWVHSYVAVLRLIALEDGLDPETTAGSIADWKRRHETARDLIREHGAPPLSAPVPADASGYIDLAPADGMDVTGLRSRTDGSWQSPGSGARGVPRSPSPHPDAAPPDLEPAPERARRYAAAYGRTGLRLLRHAEAGDGEARFRLATLLACDDHVNEAEHWLRRADVAGYACSGDPAGDEEVPHYLAAAEAAYQIGLEYEEARLPSSALLFYERAARNGHTAAAYRAGLHHVEADAPWAAFKMFSRAASNGHPDARQELDVLCRHHDLSPPAPTSSPQPPPWIPTGDS
ncbi:hypothetical protein [Spirillospora sp. NPDC047279]|uniref:tetratricopeptide repeat protein n=1 Tax=Spirillospora sp. NPDC047279 TaxID=3155478 RepID=UPI0034112634